MRIPGVLARLDDLAYPVAIERAVAELDDPEVQLPNGQDRLSTVLDRLALQTLESADDAKLAVLSALDSDAIGRKWYSDRDPPVVGEGGRERLTL